MISFCIKWKLGRKIRLELRARSSELWSPEFPFDAKTYHLVFCFSRRNIVWITFGWFIAAGRSLRKCC